MINETKTVSVGRLAYYIAIASIIAIGFFAVAPYIIGLILKEFGIIIW
jgi:hypothetical protein